MLLPPLQLWCFYCGRMLCFPGAWFMTTPWAPSIPQPLAAFAAWPLEAPVVDQGFAGLGATQTRHEWYQIPAHQNRSPLEPVCIDVNDFRCTETNWTLSKC